MDDKLDAYDVEPEQDWKASVVVNAIQDFHVTNLSSFLKMKKSSTKLLMLYLTTNCGFHRPLI